MCTLNGMKRSMQCSDLISMVSDVDEKESMTPESPDSKRRRIADSTDPLFEIEECPASAALEEALRVESSSPIDLEESFALLLSKLTPEPVLESHVKSSWVFDGLPGGKPRFSKDFKDSVEGFALKSMVFPSSKDYKGKYYFPSSAYGVTSNMAGITALT